MNDDGNGFGRLSAMSFNPFQHLRALRVPSAPAAARVYRRVTMKIIASWRNDMTILDDGEQRQMITARLNVNGRQSRILLAHDESSWTVVPVTNVTLYLLTHEVEGTPSVELRPSPGRNGLVITFGIGEQTHAELVRLAAGKYAMRYFVSFDVEVHRREIVFSVSRKYEGKLEMQGPYELLPGEPLIETYL